jgi:hypothetical protein
MGGHDAESVLLGVLPFLRARGEGADSVLWESVAGLVVVMVWRRLWTGSIRVGGTE